MIESCFGVRMFFLTKKIQHHEATSTSSFSTTEVETYYQEMDKSSSPQIIIHLRCPLTGQRLGQTIFFGGMRDFRCGRLKEDCSIINLQIGYRLFR